MAKNSQREERIAASKQFEAACETAARQYAAGQDTTAIDAEVERLLTVIESFEHPFLIS